MLAVDEGAPCIDPDCYVPLCCGPGADAVTAVLAPARVRCCGAGSGSSWPSRSPTTSSRRSSPWSPGSVASSAALIGFGLDSIVEVLSAAAVAWQFAAPDPETREKTALRIIAVSFFALAAYVTVDAVLSLIGSARAGAQPGRHRDGCAEPGRHAVPELVRAPYRPRARLSVSAIADSKQTLICTYLSAALLVGLLLNSLLGWAWADSIAALVIAVFADQ